MSGTTIIGDRMFDQLIRDYIKPGIDGTIKKIVEEEIAKAEMAVRLRLKEAVAGIAVHLAYRFNVEKYGQNISITFIEEDMKK